MLYIYACVCICMCEYVCVNVCKLELWENNFHASSIYVIVSHKETVYLQKYHICKCEKRITEFIYAYITHAIDFLIL